MNVQQEGLGCCTKCGTPIMQAINQPGVKGVCFGCKADGEVKTGRTVVVTKEIGEGLQGRVEFEEVEHQLTPSSRVVNNPDQVRADIAAKAALKGATPMPVAIPVQDEPTGEIVIRLTVDDLTSNGVVTTLLQSAYDAIDSMPPFKTLRETKKAIKLQEDIEAILKQQENPNA